MSTLWRNHFEEVMTCTDHYASGESFQICRCKDCGFQFTHPVPVEAEIGRYYETPDYISHSDTHKGLMNRVYHWVRRVMLARKARLVKHNSRLSQGSLLDIGTGTGYFPHFMQEEDGTFLPSKKALRPASLPKSILNWTWQLRKLSMSLPTSRSMSSRCGMSWNIWNI